MESERLNSNSLKRRINAITFNKTEITKSIMEYFLIIIAKYLDVTKDRNCSELHNIYTLIVNSGITNMDSDIKIDKKQLSSKLYAIERYLNNSICKSITQQRPTPVVGHDRSKDVNDIESWKEYNDSQSAV